VVKDVPRPYNFALKVVLVLCVRSMSAFFEHKALVFKFGSIYHVLFTLKATKLGKYGVLFNRFCLPVILVCWVNGL